ncbi:LysE family translocator [Aeromicrobium sp. CTD01-1L150]|uniref:LysE family translocator n=1 Tax=Aeromicrobium sp. CTD01-1L150 TaxID=3341830 RepID=UPI0035C1EF7A
MPNEVTLLTFVAAAAAILAVPGPSVVYVMSRSIEQGRAAGLLSMLGLETGALLHVVAATVGLAAVLESSPAAMTIIRYGGAGYLIYLGARQFRTVRSQAVSQARPAASRRRLFVDGVLIDVLNPKTALFFIAFLPQFIDPSRGPAGVQVLALGLCFVALAVVCDSCYALAAGSLRERVTGSPMAQVRIDTATAGVYISLGGLAVLM